MKQIESALELNFVKAAGKRHAVLPFREIPFSARRSELARQRSDDLVRSGTPISDSSQASVDRREVYVCCQYWCTIQQLLYGCNFLLYVRIGTAKCGDQDRC